MPNKSITYKMTISKGMFIFVLLRLYYDDNSAAHFCCRGVSLVCLIFKFFYELIILFLELWNYAAAIGYDIYVLILYVHMLHKLIYVAEGRNAHGLYFLGIYGRKKKYIALSYGLAGSIEYISADGEVLSQALIQTAVP